MEGYDPSGSTLLTLFLLSLGGSRELLLLDVIGEDILWMDVNFFDGMD